MYELLIRRLYTGATHVMFVFWGRILMRMHRLFYVHSPSRLILYGCDKCGVIGREAYWDAIHQAYQDGLAAGYARAQVNHIVQEMNKVKLDEEINGPGIYRYRG